MRPQRRARARDRRPALPPARARPQARLGDRRDRELSSRAVRARRQDQLARARRRLGGTRCAGSRAAPPVAERGAPAPQSSAPVKPHRQRDRCRSRWPGPADRGTTAAAGRTTAESRAGRAAAARSAGRAACGLGRRRSAERRHAWGLEQAADRELDVQGGADAADQPGRQQRMAAEVEEVVVDADPLDARAPRRTAPPGSPPAALRGARRAPLGRSSGAGSARRSSLPLGVSGSASSSTKAAGTM